MNIRKTIPWKVCKYIYYKFGIYYFFQNILINILQVIRYFPKYDHVHSEHLKHFGRDFPEKTFYVIRRFPNTGLLSDFHYVVNHTYYAISKGYIPVVNWDSYWNWHTEKTPIEIGGNVRSNSWEYFFEQPCGFSLKDIEKAKNVILGDSLKCSIEYNIDISSKSFFNDKNVKSKYSEFVSKYCKLNLNTREYIKTNKELLFGDKSNILGIIYRTAGYKDVSQHSIGASIEKMIQKLTEVFYKERFNYIFISTDEQEIVDEIYKVFPKDKIINPTRKRFKTNEHKKYIEELSLFYKKKESIFEYELNYLTEVYLLSQCDGLVASNFCNSVIFALGINNNMYRYTYTFTLGSYS